MEWLSQTLKVGFALFVVYELYAGTTWIRMRYGDDSPHAVLQPIDREDHPRMYWSVIAVETAILGWIWFR